jgi:hypothetical protein
LRERMMSISTLSQEFKEAHSDRDDKKCDEIAHEMALTPAETIDEMLDKIFAAYWLAGVRSTALYDYEPADTDPPGLQVLASLRADLETLAAKLVQADDVARDLLQGRLRPS